MQLNLTVGPSKNLVLSGNNLIAGHITVAVDFNVVRLNRYTLRISWDGSEDTDQKWVFVDGEYIASNYTYAADGTEYVDVPVDNDRTVAVEVYSGLTLPKSTEEIPNYLPIVNWKSAAEAYRYFIYMDGTLIRTLIADSGKYLNKWQTIEHLADGWHYLYVQARDAAGNTSDSITKWFRVWTPGPPVESISVTAGSGAGLYDITLGV